MRCIPAVYLLFIVLAVVIQIVISEEGEITLDSFKSKSVKELKGILTRKGLECKGCSEKADFVEMAFDAKDLPEVVPEQKEEAASSPPTPPSDADLDEILAKLQSEKFGSPKVFRPQDFEGLSPDQINAKFNNYKSPGEKKTKKKSEGKSEGKKDKKDKDKKEKDKKEKDKKEKKEDKKKTKSEGKKEDKKEKKEKSKKETKKESKKSNQKAEESHEDADTIEL